MPTGLAPLGTADARLLILGTMPSVQSLQRQQYYGHPQNAFWRLLFALWEEEWSPDYADRVAFVERHRLAVWDVLATCQRQGSADAAITEMKKRGCHNIKLMVLVAAPEGIEHLQKVHPDVDIYVGAVDDHLNEHGYIVPGLGDAGDRIFGTK